MRVLGVLVFVLAVSMSAACSAPPQKEIDLAQGAIDAARAAGAEQYATPEFTEATTALREAHDAVAQRDYRLALARALDAHDRAQRAAKAAADGKAKARSDADGAIARAAMAVEQLRARIQAAETAKLARRELDAARRAAAAAESALQKARAAVIEGDFAGARSGVEGIPEETRGAIAALDAAATKKPARPTRRGR